MKILKRSKEKKMSFKCSFIHMGFSVRMGFRPKREAIGKAEISLALGHLPCGNTGHSIQMNLTAFEHWIPQHLHCEITNLYHSYFLFLFSVFCFSYPKRD